MKAKPDITILIPLYNEDESLPHLKKALDEMLERESIKAELLFVNDGSRDNSEQLLDEFARSDSRVRVVHFRRNRGKSAALEAGFRQAKGAYVVTMDADLQDDPNEVPNLIKKLEEGFDLVSGWKKKRHDPITKTAPSKLFNFVARITSGVKLHDLNCGLKIYRREVLGTIQLYGELHRFIPILVAGEGWRVGELVVQHHARRWGRTKFGVSRFLPGFLDLLTVLFLTRFAARPMHLFGSLGLLTGITGFGILVYLSVLWFSGIAIGHRPLLTFGVLLVIVGLQFFSLGLIGEMITHHHASLRLLSSKDGEDPDAP